MSDIEITAPRRYTYVYLTNETILCLKFAVFLQVSEWFLRRGERGVFMLSVIACFGAGVFFGAYMMHLAPDVEHLLQVYWLQPADIDYPFPQLLVGLGFFMLVFIEQAMHSLNDAVDKMDNANQSEKVSYDNSGLNMEVGGAPVHAVEVSVKVEGNDSSQGLPQNASQVSLANSEAELVDSKKKMGAMKAVVMFVALSSDCIFEGLSLGLQSSEAGVWNLVIAILSHEVVIAFMLGLELLKHYTPKQVFWLGFFYAMTNPIGISTGTAIHATMGGDDVFEVVSGILQALCGGVFIYVTFIEILSREFVGSSSIIKTSAVFIGFAVMALLKLVPHGSIEEPVHPNNETVEAVTNMAQQISLQLS